MSVQNARPSPYNQLSTDSDWEALLASCGIGDGVNMSPATSLQPSLDASGRNIDMAAGKCIVKGKLWSCDSQVATAIPAASSQNRIDRLVIRLTRSATTAALFVQPVVITGTPSGSPALPALTQTTSGNWDLPICHWTSQSNGSLTGLVDERFDCGKTMHSGPAANMPSWLVRPTLYYQTDTGALMVWTGSAWVNPIPVAGSVQNMPAMTNGWAIGGHASYRITVNGDLQVSFKDLQPGTSADGTPIWGAGALPGAYQVNNNHRVVAYTDVFRVSGSAYEAAAIEFQSDGSIQCYGIATTATRLDCYATIPLPF